MPALEVRVPGPPPRCSPVHWLSPPGTCRGSTLPCCSAPNELGIRRRWTEEELAVQAAQDAAARPASRTSRKTFRGIMRLLASGRKEIAGSAAARVGPQRGSCRNYVMCPVTCRLPNLTFASSRREIPVKCRLRATPTIIWLQNFPVGFILVLIFVRFCD